MRHPSDRDGVHLALFQLQFDFLLGHEYTHHVHRHCAPDATLAVRTEFLQEEEDGSLEQQAQELDADGYSSYLLLANLLQDENRYASVLEGLGHAAHRSAASDELLFTVFFVVVLNVFCAFWRNRTEVAALYKLVHPPPPVRIKNVIQVAQMFAGQNGPVEDSWFQSSRFTELFRTAAATIPGLAGRRGTPRSHCCEVRKASGTLKRFSTSLRRLERRLNRGRLVAEWDRIGFSHGEGQVRTDAGVLRGHSRFLGN